MEVCDQRVAVCRDHANGQCRRKQCKYYHIPVMLPPADVMATILNNNTTTTATSTNNSTAIESVATAPQSPNHSSPSTAFLPYDYLLKNLTGPPTEYNCYSYVSLDSASLSPPSIISNSPFIYNSQIRGSLTPAAPSTQTSATSTP